MMFNIMLALRTGRERRTIIISGNGNHYETIGIERNKLFQTLFLPNDPFILKIKSKNKNKE